MAEKRTPGFQKGQSGNPKGRPQGSRNKTTLTLEALFDSEAENICRKCVEMALGGDIIALRLCMERILPVRRERAIVFELPELKVASDALSAMDSVARSLASGELTSTESAAICNVVTSFARCVEST